jgi:hypothetical protein
MSLGITIYNNAAGGGGGAAPSGVLFKTIEPTQYTSYRTGDEGWRVQNGFFDYTPPSNPAAVAELDYSSANYFWLLKNNLVVNGVSSKTRFVDVNGGQTFSATGNANLIVIDKLTGLMYCRTVVGSFNFNNGVDAALSHSIIVNSITYDDFFLCSILEMESIFNRFAGVSFNTDNQTGIQIFLQSTSLITSSTAPNNTGLFYYYEPSTRSFDQAAKTITSPPVYVRNARNLITAP